jgi:general nucleoside transport system ATP-binding protein
MAYRVVPPIMEKAESQTRRAASSSPLVAAIRMRGITKAFGATVANDQIDFDLEPGEIHALLGENGAGKTTLMNILFGLMPPDSGTITIGAAEVEFESPHDALAHGIGMVHQHFMLVSGFTIAENVVLGSVPPWNLSLRQAAIEQDVREVAERFGMPIDPSRRIRDIPFDTQQRVEILKLLYRGAKVLILDEPTSSLGPAQIDALFASLKDLRESGHSVVMVTHKLSEVMEIADRVTVLKEGRNSTVAKQGSFDERMLARAMTGHDLEGLPPRTASYDDTAAALLQVRELVVQGGTGINAVHGVSFDVHAGEILGVAGVEGNGQRELVDALAGLIKTSDGMFAVDGVDLTHASPRDRHAAGVSVIPEDRQSWGLVLDMTLAENLALAAIPAGRYTKNGFLQERAIRADAQRLLEEYHVRPPNPDLRALSLSGGNQQKVVLARELSRNPSVLIAANPTHGLDVGAAEYVHRRLLEVRETGSAIVLVSGDLDELLEMSDRVVVLFRGLVVYEASVE